MEVISKVTMYYIKGILERFLPTIQVDVFSRQNLDGDELPVYNIQADQSDLRLLARLQELKVFIWCDSSH